MIRPKSTLHWANDMNEDQNPHDNHGFAKLIAHLLEKLTVMAHQDGELRQLLAEAGHALIRIADGARVAGTPETVAPASNGVTPTTQLAQSESLGAEVVSSRATTETIKELLQQLDIGSQAEAQPASIVESLTTHPATAARPEDLALIENRCRLKAEACRWALKRQHLLTRGADFQTEVQPQDAEIIARAREIADCFLWMSNPNSPLPERLETYEEAAGCFDTCADVVSLLREVGDNGPQCQNFLEKAIDLAAEAQSMLRVIVDRLGAKPDSDQQKLYSFLRAVGREEQLHIGRHMRLDDPADPARRDVLQSRIEALDAELTNNKERHKRQRSLFNRIRYHLKRIGGDPSNNSEHDWAKVFGAIDELISGGLPPSSVDLRDLLIPVLENLPDAEPNSSVELVLCEVDRYLSTREAYPTTSTTVESTPEVRTVAGWLTGRSILLVGGEQRPYAKRAMEQAFNLKELVWMKTREHNTRLDFDPEVANPDVAVVLLAIRWSRHAYEDVKISCEKHDKPLVRLPRGYNPNQVANEIIAQASEQLRLSSRM